MNVEAVVRRRRKTRSGKGFSQDELSEVGLSPKQALRLGVPIDARRRSKHRENVEALRKYLKRNPKEALRPTMLKS